MISVLILTWNEEDILPACLEAVKWCDDVVVFDSFSTDRTVEIARAAGARVIQRIFDQERNQRIASLRVAFKYPWVFNPDADEILLPPLRDEMFEVVADLRRKEVAYRMRFQTMFRGQWVRRSSLYPTWFVRLFQPERISFERSVNLRYIVHGPEGRLRHHFEHRTFHKGLAAWVEKHNRYSTLEAMENVRSLARPGMSWRGIGQTDPVARRRALKDISMRLPARPLLRFLYMYIWRAGFLDGRAGLDYCVLLSLYEHMITLKLGELRRSLSAGQTRSATAPAVVPPRTVLFLNRVYPPVPGATGDLLADLARHLTAENWTVTVLTGGGPGLPVSQVEDGIRVERVPVHFSAREGDGWRALSTALLLPAIFWRALRLPRVDVVVTMTDPPMLAMVGPVLQGVKGSRLLHWAHDLYPEIAEELGVIAKDGPLARLCGLLSNWALNRHEIIVVVGRCMEQKLRQRVGPKAHIEVVPNWPGRIQPVERGDGVCFEPPVTNRFVVMYAGNLGRAHEFVTILAAASLLEKMEANILFVFTGDSQRVRQLRGQAVGLGLTNFRFLPRQPAHRLASTLGAADLHLVSLRPELLGSVVPSKTYNLLAAGRPIVFLGPATCETARTLLENRCGYVVERSDGGELASLLLGWSRSRDSLKELAENGLRYTAENSREKRLAQFVRALEMVAHSTVIRTMS